MRFQGIIEQTIDKTMDKLRRLMNIFCFLATYTLPQVLAQFYNVKVSCGTCQNTSGCTGNICLIVTGDIQNQYRYGTSTCTLTLTQTITVGKCSADFSGATCQSGICAMGASINMCYGSSYCLDGVSFNATCTNGQINFQMYGGLYETNTYNSTIPMNESCPFTSAYGNYSECSFDSLGIPCNCCFSARIQGISSATGTCIPQNSPMVQMKNDMNCKYGFYILVKVALILIQILVLSL